MKNELQMMNYGINTRCFVTLCQAKKDALSTAVYVQCVTGGRLNSRGFQSSGVDQASLNGPQLVDENLLLCFSQNSKKMNL